MSSRGANLHGAASVAQASTLELTVDSSCTASQFCKQKYNKIRCKDDNDTAALSIYKKKQTLKPEEYIDNILEIPFKTRPVQTFFFPSLKNPQSIFHFKHFNSHMHRMSVQHIYCTQVSISHFCQSHAGPQLTPTLAATSHSCQALQLACEFQISGAPRETFLTRSRRTQELNSVKSKEKVN